MTLYRWLRTMLSRECIRCGSHKPLFCSYCDRCFKELGW